MEIANYFHYLFSQQIAETLIHFSHCYHNISVFIIDILIIITPSNIMHNINIQKMFLNHKN